MWLLRDTPAYLVCWQGTAVLDCEDRRQVAVWLGKLWDLRGVVQLLD